MAVTLEEAKNNALDDFNPFVIDEFRKGSTIIDSLIFKEVVNPAGGGGSLTHTYRRLIEQPTADFREYNQEYIPSEAKTEKISVELSPLGQSFRVDRDLAPVGPASSGAVWINVQQGVKAISSRFSSEVINGDLAVDDRGFDGLNTILKGTDQELTPTSVNDWTDFDTDPRSAYKAIDKLDEFLHLLDAPGTIIVGNSLCLAKVRAAARRANALTSSPVDNLFTTANKNLFRDYYAGIVIADAGSNGAKDVIPTETRVIGGSSVQGLTDLYIYRVEETGLTGLITNQKAAAGDTLVQTFLPNFAEAGNVKLGQVQLGPVAVALENLKAAAVLRNIKVF